MLHKAPAKRVQHFIKHYTTFVAHCCRLFNGVDNLIYHTKFVAHCCRLFNGVDNLIYHTKFVGTFHLSRSVSDENRTCSISICFFQNYGALCGKVIFKNRILKNGSCERALSLGQILAFLLEIVFCLVGGGGGDWGNLSFYKNFRGATTF